jgi:hypothetical protein
MLDRARHQLGLGREVVQLRASGETGAPRDLRGAGTGIAEVVQALDGRVEEARSSAGAALGLGSSLSSCDRRYLPHASWVPRY